MYINQNQNLNHLLNHLRTLLNNLKKTVKSIHCNSFLQSHSFGTIFQCTLRHQLSPCMNVPETKTLEPNTVLHCQLHSNKRFPFSGQRMKDYSRQPYQHSSVSFCCFVFHVIHALVFWGVRLSFVNFRGPFGEILQLKNYSMFCFFWLLFFFYLKLTANKPVDSTKQSIPVLSMQSGYGYKSAAR